MNLLSVLLDALVTKPALSALSKKTGVKSSSLKKLLPAAVPVLLKFLTKNASDKEGASSLLGALTEHAAAETAAEQIAEADTVDGGKILSHIFGSNKEGTLASLAALTGLDELDVTKALSGIAPTLLSALSAAVFGSGRKRRSKKGLNLSGLLSMLLGKKSCSLGSIVKGLFSGGTARRQKKDSSVNGSELLSYLLEQIG